MSITKYGKCEWDRLGSRKWMRCSLVDEMNEIDFGIWK